MQEQEQITVIKTTSVQDKRQVLVEQEELIRQQDEVLDVLHDSVKRLKEISHTLGQELDVQNRLLDGIDQKVENTTDKLKDANKQVKKIEKKVKSPCVIS